VGHRRAKEAKEESVTPLLELQGMTKTFGGLTANDSISFDLEQGGLLGVIGPNGAGKTTLFNCIAGALRIDSGRIFFDGRDVTRLGAYRMARLGLARTFQVYVASGDLNVRENVMVGCFMKTRSRSRAGARADEILEYLNLHSLSHNMMSELPVAAQKRVAMATALGTAPRLLLLDEVAAGLNPSEIEEMIKTIRFIHSELGITIMLIEHVMEMVIKVSHRVMVLDYGRKIAEGDPEVVVKDPAVIKAYLGERFAREHVLDSQGV
jgi:branched-chain amino acid transport system ATP-binding protein